jgi:hypothetical protein
MPIIVPIHNSCRGRVGAWPNQVKQKWLFELLWGADSFVILSYATTLRF